MSWHNLLDNCGEEYMVGVSKMLPMGKILPAEPHYPAPHAGPMQGQSGTHPAPHMLDPVPASASPGKCPLWLVKDTNHTLPSPAV